MNRLRLCLLVLVATCLSGAPVVGQQGAPDRQVPRTAGKRVQDAIRPGEKSVELIDTSDGPLLVQPPADQSLTEWLFNVVDGVVLARVDGRVAALTPGGDWIQSDITATVVEVFKAPKGKAWAPKAKIAFKEEGGEVQVNGVRVNGVVPGSRGTKNGQTYLMFLSVDPDDGRVVAGPDAIYELSNGRFTRLSRPATRLHDLDKIEADLSDQVLSEFRQLGGKK